MRIDNRQRAVDQVGDVVRQPAGRVEQRGENRIRALGAGGCRRGGERASDRVAVHDADDRSRQRRVGGAEFACRAAGGRSQRAFRHVYRHVGAAALIVHAIGRQERHVQRPTGAHVESSAIGV